MALTSVEQAPWTQQGEEKRASVRELFASIAPRYDLLNSLMSLRLHGRWRRIAVKMLKLNPGDRSLDVCCGTGDFMAPLRKAVGPSGEVMGVDFCLPMLAIARKKRSTEPVFLGDACRLPMQPAEFDSVSVGWGIRNVPDIDAAHREAIRVLKPGGRFVSLDMAKPRNRFVRSISQLTFDRIVPLLGALFGSRDAYKYLPESSKRFLTRQELIESMQSAGFVDVRCRDLFFGNICIHFGRKP